MLGQDLTSLMQAGPAAEFFGVWQGNGSGIAQEAACKPDAAFEIRWRELSLSANAAAAGVVLSQRVRRPARLPDWPDCPDRPFRTALRAPAPTALALAHQSSASPWSNRQAVSAPTLGREYAPPIRQFLDRHHRLTVTLSQIASGLQ